MTEQAAYSVASIGRELQPLVTFDGFAPDPDALRRDAIARSFSAARNHYPGIRADLPQRYWAGQRPIVAQAVRHALGLSGSITLIDASFSIVTTARDALSVRQRLPHCDAFAANRIALIHYLSPEAIDGTAFFRHRSTGFESVTDDRRAIFFDQLEAELRLGDLPAAGYIADDTSLFERIAVAEGRYNRALLYRSNQLHSGAIGAAAVLSPDPARGRLTITAFLSVD